MRGRADGQRAKPLIERDEAERSWKNEAARPTAARARDRGQMRTPCAPQRVDSEARPPRRSWRCCPVRTPARDQRAEVGERRLRPIDRRHRIARLPVAQARQLKPVPANTLRVIARRDTRASVAGCKLDLRHLGGIDQHADSRRRSRHRHLRDHVVDHVSTVTPWLAACGASHTR